MVRSRFGVMAARRQLRESAGGSRWTGFGEPVQRFMADYEASTVPHVETNPHRDPHEGLRRHPNGVVSSVHPRMDPMEGERPELFVQWLNASHPGQGHGSATMRELTKLADRHRVTMTLEPNRPPGHRGPGPDDAGLERWYGKHGFRMGEYGIMTRHPRRLRESRADTLIRRKLDEGTVSRGAFGERHYWRKPGETMTANQLSDADVTTWMPDSHHASDRSTSGRSSSTVTLKTKGKRGRTTSTPMLQIQRTASGDGTYVEKQKAHAMLQRADRRFSNTGAARMTPHSDEFTVELDRGVLDKTFHEPWSKTFNKYGHGEVFNNARDEHGNTVKRKLASDDMQDAVYLRYDNPHSAVHMARTFAAEPGLKVRVRHDRHFSANGAPPDRNWPQHVGEIDYRHDPTPDGRFKYKRSFHATLEHAKATGQPHRCTDVRGVPGPARCTGEHPCPASRAATR